MARFFRVNRINALAESKSGRYLAYATGEILLIFFGITLALWFSNLNEERSLREIELATLQELAENLRAHMDTVEANIARDRSSLGDCEKIVDLFDKRDPWLNEHSPIMYNCRTWTSPYMQDAAYESLRLRGTDLLSNRDVRSAIVFLYKNVYDRLLGDTDRTNWVFETAVWGPVYARYFEHRSAETVRPSDYDAVVEASEFRNALLRHMLLLEVSMADQEETLTKTRETLGQVEEEAFRLSAD